MNGRRKLRQGRPTVRTAAPRSPVLRATVAFGLSGVLVTVPRIVEPLPPAPELLVIYGLAVTALAAGILMLIESAAVQKIQDLRTSSKMQLDELARARLYAEQIGEALGEVHEFRARPGRSDSMPLVNRLLDSASTRASVAFDPSVRFYVVESTVRGHVVKATAGTEPLAIEVGKSCPADRSLEEVASTLALHQKIVPVSIGAASCSLVMLSNRPPGETDCNFVEHLALVLGLADRRLGRRSHGRSHSPAKLRAV